MSDRVSELEFDDSIGLYGSALASGAVRLRTSSRLDGFSAITWARVEEPGAGVPSGYYFVRARARAVLPAGWWASILLYAVDGSLKISAAASGTSNARHFREIGEFEGAADFASAQTAQHALDQSRRNPEGTV